MKYEKTSPLYASLLLILSISLVALVAEPSGRSSDFDSDAGAPYSALPADSALSSGPCPIAYECMKKVAELQTELDEAQLEAASAKLHNKDLKENVHILEIISWTLFGLLALAICIIVFGVARKD